MSKIVFLLLIIGVKILLTKLFLAGFFVAFIIIKSKVLHHDSSEWSKYFLSLEETKVGHFSLFFYFLSSIISMLICYLLFLWLNFAYPLRLTLIIFLICSVYSLCKYKNTGKKEIAIVVQKVKNKAKENQ